jgi:hypothetical protein
MRKHSEIVDEILGELKPLRDGVSIHDARNDVITSLYLLNLGMEFLDRSSVAKTRTRLKQVLKTVHRLKHQLTSLPKIYRPPFGYGEGSTPMSLEKILAITDKLLTHDLARKETGDPLKRQCASWAYVIMVRLSQKRLTSSSARSPLRVIASLIYEKCKGREVDLERACEAALKFRPTLDDVCLRENFEYFLEGKRARVRVRTSVH